MAFLRGKNGIYLKKQKVGFVTSHLGKELHRKSPAGGMEGAGTWPFLFSWGQKAGGAGRVLRTPGSSGHSSSPPFTQNLRAPPAPATPQDKVKAPPLAPGVSLREGEGSTEPHMSQLPFFYTCLEGPGLWDTKTLNGVGTQVSLKPELQAQVTLSTPRVGTALQLPHRAAAAQNSFLGIPLASRAHVQGHK